MNNETSKNVAMYLDWFNNFLTLPKFAEYYEISEIEARAIIKKGKLEFNLNK